MAKSFITKEKQGKKIKIDLEIEGKFKTVKIDDYDGDEAEQLHAICRELKLFEDSLLIN